MKRRLLLLAVTLVLCLGGAWAYSFLTRPKVTLAQPTKRRLVRTVVSSGRVLPPRHIQLSALASGNVVALEAEEGQQVKGGAVLLRLDDAEAAAAVAQAGAGLERARAGAHELRRLSLPAAKERLLRAEATLGQAEASLERDEALLAESVIAAAVVEQGRTTVAVARSERAAAELGVQAASGAGSQTLAAKATIAEAEARLAAAKAARSRTVVIAPFDGTVLSRHVESGDAVQAGTRLFEIAGVGETRLVVEPDERNLSLLAVGQKAVASAEAYPKETFEAEVSYIAPSVDPRRGTVEVHLRVAKPPPYLVVDMTVSVEVQVGARDGATVVPTGAVAQVKGERAEVFVLAGGRVARKPVEIGIVSDDVVEILGGLSGDEPLAVPLSGELPDGARVRVVVP